MGMDGEDFINRLKFADDLEDHKDGAGDEEDNGLSQNSQNHSLANSEEEKDSVDDFHDIANEEDD